MDFLRPVNLNQNGPVECLGYNCYQYLYNYQ